MLDELDSLYNKVEIMDEEIRAYQVKMDEMHHEIELR